MSAEIIPFDFETNAVRVVMIDGAPWFVAADVCRVLEHKNPTVALNRLDDDEKRTIDPKLYLGSSVSGGGAQMMNIISESGLYALILTSNKPAAKRFRKWVTAEVLPAIRRDGSYGLASPDRAELEAKRAFYRGLPEAHRDRADTRVEALRRIEELIAQGSRIGAAVDQVAAEVGMSRRSLYAYRRTTYMVAHGDRAAALAPRWSQPRGMLADCHPEALRLFLTLCATPMRVPDAYRRTVAEATAKGWVPIPCERTLRRAAGRQLPIPSELRPTEQSAAPAGRA